MYIQEISKQFHISKKAINLYEEKGLIKPQKDIQRLLMIKQLRNLNFSIQEIKDILNYNCYQLFDQKIQEYQNKYYELDTSLQYINEVKEIVLNKQDIKKLSIEMDQTYDLKNIEVQDYIVYPFDRYSFSLVTSAMVLLSINRPDDIYSLLAAILWLIALGLTSAQVQTYIYKYIKK